MEPNKIPPVRKIHEQSIHFLMWDAQLLLTLPTTKEDKPEEKIMDVET